MTKKKKTSQDFRYTIMERKFCHAITHGMGKREAYEEAGYLCHGDMNDNVRASRVANKPKIKILINEMIEDSQKAARMTKDKLIDWLTDLVLTDQEDIENVQNNKFSVKGQPQRVKHAIAGIIERPSKYGSTFKTQRWDAVRAASLLAELLGLKQETESQPVDIKIVLPTNSR